MVQLYCLVVFARPAAQILLHSLAARFPSQCSPVLIKAQTAVRTMAVFETCFGISPASLRTRLGVHIFIKPF